MSFTHKSVPDERPESGLKRYREWDGDWQSYLAYLDKNNSLSPNFIQEGGRYRLRPGYNPAHELKDFK